MMEKKYVKEVLRLMGSSIEKNVTILMQNFKKYGVSKNEYLFTLTDELYDGKSCLLAIKSLIAREHANPNIIGDFKYNFIQNAIYAGYSENFITELIEFTNSLKNKLDINHQDDDGDTILHTAIYADDFVGNIYEIYKCLIKHGFDSRIKDKAGRSIVDAMLYEKKIHNIFSDQQINQVRELYRKEVERLNKETNRNAPIDKVLNKMGYDLKANKEILNKELPKLGIKKDEFLFGLTDELHHELSCFAAIKTLLYFETCRVNLTDESKYNFIQNALYAGYGTEFINACIDASNDSMVTHQLSINHQDEDGDTMLHTAIYANDEASVDIVSFYKKLLKHGFDSTIKDNGGRNIIDAMRYEKKRCNKFSNEQIKEVEKIYNAEIKIENTSFTSEELESNIRLNKDGLENFLKRCSR